MSRLKIAVLFGGCSPEYGVSLQSAAAVLRHMDQSRYEPVMVGISQAGDWFHYTGPVDSIERDTSGVVKHLEDTIVKGGENGDT